MDQNKLLDLLNHSDDLIQLIDQHCIKEPKIVFDDHKQAHYYWVKETEFNIEVEEQSFLNQTPLFKIVFKNNHTYFLVALPIIQNNEKKLIELSKDISQSGSLYIDEFKDGSFYEILSEIQHEILHDGLTGVFKEQHGYKKLQESLNANHYPLCLIYFSVNHMFEINQLFTQKAGDMMLIQVARLLQNYCVSDLDFVVRLNGPRFYLVLHNTTKQRAYSIAKAINRKSQLNTYYLNQEALKLSLNIGYSCLSEKSIDVDRFIQSSIDEVLIDNAKMPSTLPNQTSKNSEILKLLS